ncbi:MAG: iron ABC transporter permease [Sphaerochaetaceae bacterium]|nr:iron ABC transporter permease [Sphaerochaetaceae bacterium]
MKKITIFTIICITILSIIAMLSLVVGVKIIPFSKVIAYMNHNDLDSITSAIITKRIPRTIFGILAGASLATSGALMQSITRNPIADPSILGVNTGASLFVVIGLAFFNITSANQYIWLSIVGAWLTAFFVYAIASMGKQGATPLKLALSGSAISIALGSFVSTIMLPNNQIMNSFRFWQVGSIGGASMESIKLLLPFFIIGFILSILISQSLDNLALGDELATSLGTNTLLIRILGAFAGVLLCGATTALAGPIGFIGLMVPHIIRSILGNNMKVVLVFSVLIGAIILLGSDIIGRVIGYPSETEVGIVTAILGAPVFITIIRHTKVNAL